MCSERMFSFVKQLYSKEEYVMEKGTVHKNEGSNKIKIV